MNFAILISTFCMLTLTNSEIVHLNSVSVFDNSSYIVSEITEKAVDSHFVKDVKNESELFKQFTAHFEQLSEVVDHITINRIDSDDISYYAVYKSKESLKSVELFKVDSEDFTNESMSSERLDVVAPTRRYGLGFDFWCPPVCDAYPIGSCLGFSC